MSKARLLQLLALAAANAVMGTLAACAFLIWIFRGDPVLAAVPAFFALPLVLLQPWYLPMGLWLPGGLALAPVYTTAVSAALYGTLLHTGRLDGVLRRAAAIDRRRAARVALGLVLLGALVTLARHLDVPPLRQGVPPELRRVVDDLELVHENARYYTLRTFFDRESLWRATLSKAELERLAVRLEMRDTHPQDLQPAFRDQSPYWWKPRLAADSRAFQTPGFPPDRGPDGRHAAASWSPGDRVLYLWIKDNF